MKSNLQRIASDPANGDNWAAARTRRRLPVVRIHNEHIPAFVGQWSAAAEQRDLRAEIRSRAAIALEDDSLELVVG